MPVSDLIDKAVVVDTVAYTVWEKQMPTTVDRTLDGRGTRTRAGWVVDDVILSDEIDLRSIASAEYLATIDIGALVRTGSSCVLVGTTGPGIDKLRDGSVGIDKEELC